MAGSSTHDQWIDRHDSLGHYEKVGYVGLGEGYNKWIYDLRERHFRALVDEYRVGAMPRVLDVGLGNGFYIDIYDRAGARDITGVDLSPRSVDLAQARFQSGTFEVADITEPLDEALVGAGFDWVSAMDMLYHIVEDALFARGLEHCGRAVRAGGYFVTSDNFPRAKLPATGTQAFHTLAEYEAILRPLGFELVELSPVFFVSNGQVGDGLRHSVASRSWRTVARVIGKAIRLHRPTGELIGSVAGAALTTADRALQHQRWVDGFSTKVAVFQRG